MPKEMKFGEAIKSVFSKYATFSGRARRKEYWHFCLLNFSVYLVYYIILMIIVGGAAYAGYGYEHTMREGVLIISTITMLYSLAVLLPSIAVSVRRLHDTGRSGALWLLGFIPLAGPIILLVFFCGDSVLGDNQYGPDPKWQ